MLNATGGIGTNVLRLMAGVNQLIHLSGSARLTLGAVIRLVCVGRLTN